MIASILQRIADLVVAPLRLDSADGGGESLSRAVRLASDSGITSFIVFGGDAPRLSSARMALETAAGRSVLLFADLERGCGQQIAGTTELPCAMAIGATGLEALAERCGECTAGEASLVGIQVVLAPVLDVNVNPRNPIINTRAFGGDPAAVARLGCAFARGVRAAGGIPAAKHFPGHGDTECDSHLELPVLEAPEDVVLAVHVAPFQAAIRDGIPAMMLAHLAAPALERRGKMPAAPLELKRATASEAVVEGLLRSELGFDGVAMTDALIMGGASPSESSAEEAVGAIAAGCDLALYPPDGALAVEAIERAVKSGRIPRDRIEEAAERVAALRAWTEDRAPTDSAEDSASLPREVAEEAVTLVSDGAGLLPIARSLRSPIELVLVPDPAGSRTAVLERSLRERFPDLHVSTLEAADVPRLGSPRGVRILAGFGSPRGFRRGIPSIAPKPEPHQILVSLGSPYLFGSGGPPDGQTFVCAYGDGPALCEAAARAIAGEIPFRGRLPVSLEGRP